MTFFAVKKELESRFRLVLFSYSARKLQRCGTVWRTNYQGILRHGADKLDPIPDFCQKKSIYIFFAKSRGFSPLSLAGGPA